MKEKVYSRSPESIRTPVSDTLSSRGHSVDAPDSGIHFALQKKDAEITTLPASPLSQFHATINDTRSQDTIQPKSYATPAIDINFTIQKKENKTGLPDQLKSGIENLSGHSMDDVNVHYNSAQPAQLKAHAYAQGNQIHIAPGQEKHLAHEAWHVVQQKQGRVKPTKQLKSSVAINDDTGLEREADVMGARAGAGIQLHRNTVASYLPFKSTAYQTVQRRIVKQDEGEPLRLDKIVSDSQLEDELEGYDDAFKAVAWYYQRRRGRYYSFQQVMALALRTRIDHLPPDDDDHDVDSSSSELDDDVPEPGESPGKSSLTKKLPAITRINSSYISPRSPVYAPLSASVKSKGENWEDNRDDFVRAFNTRIQSGMKSGHPSSLQGSDNNLSRLAWIIETLNQARTCVAVILSDTHLHVFANHHDAKLQTQLQDLITASQDLRFASKEYHAILHLLTEHVLVNRGSRPKKKETIDRKTGMVQRRLQKAMQLINQLNLGLNNIKVHEVNQSHKGRKKHGEMRAGDAVASSRKGDKTPLQLDAGISKICCGKCELALQALSGIYGITFKVQEAHWQIYDTDTGWPVPEFLKTNPEAMKMFLGDEAYEIYVKFPAEATRVIEGMKKEVKSKEKLTNPSSKDTGYISSEDEYDMDKYSGDKGGPSGIEDDKNGDSYSSSSESDDDYDELDFHEVIDGYDEDGTPDITISDHMIQLYLQDLELSGAYLSVAEGQVIAAALNVRAHVFNRLTVSTNGYYYDPDNNQYYQGTLLQTLADGDCLLHGLNLIRQNHNMSQAQIRICRLYIGNILDHDLLRVQIEDLVRAKIQGEYIPGLGPNMSRILNFNYEIQKAMHQEASKSSFKSVSVSHSGHVPKKDSSIVKEDHEQLPDDDELVAPYHHATGTIAFNTTYGNTGPEGCLLFTGDHYIRIAPCDNPFG